VIFPLICLAAWALVLRTACTALASLINHLLNAFTGGTR
jgi:hypothetical protein